MCCLLFFSMGQFFVLSLKAYRAWSQGLKFRVSGFPIDLSTLGSTGQNKQHATQKQQLNYKKDGVPLLTRT